MDLVLHLKTLKSSQIKSNLASYNAGQFLPAVVFAYHHLSLHISCLPVHLSLSSKGKHGSVTALEESLKSSLTLQYYKTPNLEICRCIKGDGFSKVSLGIDIFYDIGQNDLGMQTVIPLLP